MSDMVRRSAAGWIVGVAAVVAAGLVGGWLFERSRPPQLAEPAAGTPRDATDSESTARGEPKFADADGDHAPRKLAGDPLPQTPTTQSVRSPGSAPQKSGSAPFTAPMLAKSPGTASTHDDQSPRRENRLAKESSPYLLLHKHNPVDWYPWGPEAFERAKREDKPIFLSIGYTACYWCHVMERESFSDEEIAKKLNDNFICIKVDREERPDVDELYMSASQFGWRRSGWPLSIFLTPDRKPFFGGTYFPPRERDGMTGFAELLDKLLAFWKENRETAEETGEQVLRGVERMLRPRGFALEPLTRAIAARAVAGLAAQFDPEFGGFGFHPQQPRRPKFPQPPLLEFLAYQAQRGDDAQARAMLALTLEKLSDGGIRDHLGGGFHRYSTDRFWRVPHFEKMLYDNAQLARVYLEAFELTGRKGHADIAKTIFAFVANELTSPDGGFYSSIDAESEHEEGRYYVWTIDELKAELKSPQLEFFARVNGLTGPPHLTHGDEPGRYVLHLTGSLADLAATQGMSAGDLAGLLHPAAKKLLEARNKRTRPITDTKIMTDWNGLMIAALADGFRVLGDDAYRKAAERAAELMLTKCRTPEGRLLHILPTGNSKLPGLLEDYAFLAQGLLALNRATGDERWLKESRSIADEMIELFGDDSAGGFFHTADDHEMVLVRLKTLHDGVLPSGNSAAARVLVALADRTGDDRYAAQAARTLAAFSGVLATDPSDCANMARGLCEYLDAELPATLLNARPTLAVPDVVQARALLSVSKLERGRPFQMAVLIEIDPSWHIYANPSSARDFPPTTVSLDGGELPLDGVKITYPPSRSFEAEGVSDAIAVYNERAIIRVTATLNEKVEATKGQLKLTLRYQACNNQRCLAPKTVELVMPVEVAGPDEPVKETFPDVFGPRPDGP